MNFLGPMHACLNVDEIVRHITYELVALRAKRTAVALGCCCQSFEDPALDTLWETQTPVTQVFAERCLEWARMQGECANGTHLPFP